MAPTSETGRLAGLSRRLGDVFHLGLRSATLVLRFALTFYIVRYLGYEASGIYGLAVGAVGIVPAMIGWGLNYFVAREVIGIDIARAAVLIKTRLVVTSISLVLFALVAGVAFVAFGIEWHWYYALILAIVVFETFALDMHMPLLALDMAKQANILVFIRSAMWVPLMIGLGLAVPETNTLDTVFLFWICSHVVGMLVLVRFLRHWSLRTVLATPIRRDWLRERLTKSWHIYLSDLSMVGMLYADRYIVSYLLGLQITGIYTFYWSLTNALQTLVSTAIVQVLFPKVFKSYEPGNIVPFVHVLRSSTIKVMSIAAGMSVLLFAFGEVAVHFLPDKTIAGFRWVFVLLIAAAVVRTCSEMLNMGLTTIRKDQLYASLNILGMILALTLAFLFILAFGFLGVGIAAIATAMVLAAIRAWFLVQFIRSEMPSAPRSTS